MGAGNAGSNSGGGSPNQMAKDKAKKDRIENAKSRDKFGYTKPKSKFKTFIEGGGIIGAVTKPFRDASEEVNRKFYNEKVVPAGKSKAPNYETYMKDRLAGKTDAYGNTISQNNNDNNNQPVIVQKNVGGQTVQTTEAKVEEDKKEATQYDERVTKKKGRSKNILTSKQGVMKTSADYSLGKKSLLGQVV